MKEKKSPSLSLKQMLFLKEFAERKYTVTELLKKQKVHPSTYRRWMCNMLFVEEMNARIESSRKDSQILLAQLAPAAAETLAKLAESDGETGRKACLDILKLSGQDGEDKTIATPEFEISDELAEKVLEMMAGRAGD